MKRGILFLFSAVIFLAAFTFNSYSQNWTTAGSVTGAGTFPSISVADPNTVWIGGGATGVPKVFRSTNGGTTFTDVTGNLTTNEFYCIWAVDANVCYVGDGGAAGGTGGNAKVWKTTNGGTLWTNILTTGGTAGFINGICFSRTNPQVGFIESDPPTGAGNSYWVQKTTNGGVNWTLQSPPGISGDASAQNTLVITDENHYGFGSSASAAPSYIIYTTNGGTNWTNIVISSAGNFTSAFAMATDWSNGVATSSTTLPVIARTTNGCSTFSNVNGVAGLTGTATCKWVPGTQHLFMMSTVGASGCCEQSFDGGATWSVMSTAGAVGITHMELVYIGTLVSAYAVTASGSVIKLSQDLTGIDPGNTSIPNTYNLEQNYPNPFNPTTNIRYSLPKGSYVTLKIFDMLGHEVKTIVNNIYQNSGNYIETVDASNLASGIYFYTIRTNDFTATKKMSLIK